MAEHQQEGELKLEPASAEPVVTQEEAAPPPIPQDKEPQNEAGGEPATTSEEEKNQIVDGGQLVEGNEKGEDETTQQPLPPTIVLDEPEAGQRPEGAESPDPPVHIEIRESNFHIDVTADPLSPEEDEQPADAADAIPTPMILETPLPITPSPAELEEEEIDEEELQRIAAAEQEALRKKLEAQKRKAIIKELLVLEAREKSIAQLYNSLETTLATYFHRKQKDQKPEKLSKAAQEQQYLKYLIEVKELETKFLTMQDKFARHIEHLTMERDSLNTSVREHVDGYRALFKETAKNCACQRTGKNIPPAEQKEMDAAFLTTEALMTEERTRLFTCRFAIETNKKEIEERENIGEGLHMLDYEQLKIENQQHSETIEAHHEDLQKYASTIAANSQVLSHVKEKLSFTENENQGLREKLRTLEESVALNRDLLVRSKKVKEKLQAENERLKKECGLIGQDHLLRDFELQRDERDECASLYQTYKSQQMEYTHAARTLDKQIKKVQGETLSRSTKLTPLPGRAPLYSSSSK